MLLVVVLALKIMIAIISIAPYFTDKGELTVLYKYKINNNVTHETSKMILYNHIRSIIFITYTHGYTEEM